MPPHDRAARAARQRLESLQQAGVSHLGRAAPVEESPVQSVSEPSGAVAEPVVAPGSNNAAAELDVIRQRVAGCTRCAELASTRTQTVFGTGNPQARLVMLGEAPGADEDRQGEPFVGRAGQLLTKILEACTLQREDVYILNILKCRPPGNRNPLPDEAANCREYLDAQLAIIQPEYICCMGAVAARNLLEVDTSIGKMRGKFYRYNDIKVLCTYHPAYLLRNPSAKRQVWEDMQFLMAEMGIELPEK
ncbi:MAG: uracil-DNA glycosylase [Pirellulales bacterium]|nr:uracil-DNA glycosylase [Pirellulales bacterium]